MAGRDEHFAEFAWQATRSPSVAETMVMIVQTACEAVGADAAGITILRSGGGLVSVAETSDLVSRSDQVQHAIGEGPCVEAAVEAHHVASVDLTREGRWPHWAPQAVHLGLRSVLSTTLHTVLDRRLGALNLYGFEARQFDRQAIETARLFAGHATAALWAAVERENLQIALGTRTKIGQAQGILMNRYGLTDEQATRVLKRYSQQTNTKLRLVAEDIVDRGDLPPAPSVEPAD